MSVKQRGFGSMPKHRQREIASKGGKAAHQKGTAYEWDSAAARAAGRKGGAVSRGGRGRLPAGTRVDEHDNPLPSTGPGAWTAES